MDHEEPPTAPTPQPGDPLIQYSVGCVSVILMWLAVSWAATYLASR